MLHRTRGDALAPFCGLFQSMQCNRKARLRGFFRREREARQAHAGQRDARFFRRGKPLGIVRREVYPEVPPRVEYSLTPYGRTLCPITELMCAWGKEHIKRLEAGGAGGLAEADPN